MTGQPNDATSPFHLRFPVADIPFYAARYDNPVETVVESEVAPSARAHGYLTQAELVQLARWKSPRITSRCAANESKFIEAVTGVALSTPNEQLRIRVLLLLFGVGWPMASSILHWCHRDPYPILDYRALWSFGFDSLPVYDFPFWQAYTRACRELTAQAGVSMRQLDRALWQYSWENQ
jgi:hypothetical protein